MFNSCKNSFELLPVKEKMYAQDEPNQYAMCMQISVKQGLKLGFFTSSVFVKAFDACKISFNGHNLFWSHGRKAVIKLFSKKW